MTNNLPNFFEKAGNWLRQSVTVRIFTIGILILLLLIPVSMVESLIRERQFRQEEAIREVSSKWGGTQVVSGPVLTVPFRTFSKVFEGNQSETYKLVESRAYAHFLPENLDISGDVKPEERNRGIYKVIVYNSKLTLTGKFNLPDFKEWDIDNQNVIWEDAFVSIGLTDLRSIQENISINWNGSDLSFSPGVESNDVIVNGISVRIKELLSDSAEKQINFSMKMNFNGSSDLQFIPLGKETTVALQSKWANPKFDGAFLPDRREVTGDGFTADWKVLHLNRPYPQSFRGATNGIQESAFGVTLIVPVDEYQKSTRSAKYAAMFITLTFLVFFFVQVLNKVKIHPIQYIMVGLALCVFYTLLIALSEHISFGYSYLISSIAIIGLISLYAKSIFKNKLLTWMILLILSMLYLFIFSIIQMEDYALLMGSTGLFLVLAVVMYLSRKIDWYGVNE